MLPAPALTPEAADQADGQTIAVLSTRGFVARPGRTIAAATFAGLLAMGISFAVSSSPIVGMLALFAGILAVFGLRTGDVDFRLTREGLHRTFVPFAGIGGRGRREQVFAFTDMRSFRRDRDLSRYRQEEVERLVITLRRPPFRIVIHDMMGKEAFADFADRFGELATAAGVPRRPSFYASLWAKLLLAVFALAAGGLLVLQAVGTLSPTNTFRLMVVILPGVAYMGWRILARPRDGAETTGRAAGRGG